MRLSLEERVKALEEHVKKESKPEGSDSMKNKKPSREPREPSEYNKFVKRFIEEQRVKHPTKPHRELFAEAAKEWSNNKNKN